MMASSSRDLALTLAIVAVAVGTVVLAQVLPSADRVRGPATSAFGDREPTCTAWSDGCITCERTDRGPSCSTPGIACVRSPVQCLRRDGV
jgi:hypothetical protein